MHSIFIGSTGGEPGQTLVTWALAIKMKEIGVRVGFFKPFRLLPDRNSAAEGIFFDSDVFLLKEALGLTEPRESLCPVMLAENLISNISGNQVEELTKKIQEAFQEISSGKDVVLIMGAKEIFLGGGLSGLSDSALVKLFDASVLLVDRYQRDNLTLYSLLSLNSFLDGRVNSAVINYIDPDKKEHVRTKVIPFLQEKGIQNVLAVPKDPILSAITVETLAGLVDGQILCCPEHAGNLIATFTIGSRNLESSLAIFKQVYNKIILSGIEPKRGGEGGISGIILTGGKIPGELVLRAAQNQSIPLILTRADTFQTMEHLEKARPTLTLKDEFKARRFLRLVDQEIDSKQWVKTLL